MVFLKKLNLDFFILIRISVVVYPFSNKQAAEKLH